MFASIPYLLAISAIFSPATARCTIIFLPSLNSNLKESRGLANVANENNINMINAFKNFMDNIFSLITITVINILSKIKNLR